MILILTWVVVQAVEHLLVGVAQARVGVEHFHLRKWFAQQHNHGHDHATLAKTRRHDQQGARASLSEPRYPDSGHCILAYVRSVIELSHVCLNPLPPALERFDLRWGHHKWRLTVAVVSSYAHSRQSFLHSIDIVKLDAVYGLHFRVSCLLSSLFLLENRCLEVVVPFLQELLVLSKLLPDFKLLSC